MSNVHIFKIKYTDSVEYRLKIDPASSLISIYFGMKWLVAENFEKVNISLFLYIWPPLIFLHLSTTSSADVVLIKNEITNDITSQN